MKKIITILFLVMLVGCGGGQTFEEKELKFVGNATVKAKYTKEIAIFEDKDGSVLTLYWHNKEPKPLEKDAVYKVQYQTNDFYTTYMEIINYDKQ